MIVCFKPLRPVAKVEKKESKQSEDTTDVEDRDTEKATAHSWQIVCVSPEKATANSWQTVCAHASRLRYTQAIPDCMYCIDSCTNRFHGRPFHSSGNVFEQPRKHT